MSVQTPYLKLIKPDRSEPVRVGDLNANFDLLDAGVKARADALAAEVQQRQQQYAGIIVPRPYTAVVGNTGKGDTATSCDYLCTGTADQGPIQAAVDAVAAAGGGAVLLRRGNYSTTQPITLPSGVRLVGEGMNLTRITPTGTGWAGAYGDAAAVIRNTGNVSTVHDWWVEDLSITCHANKQYLYGIWSHCTYGGNTGVRRVSITEFGDCVGIYLDNTVGFTVDNCYLSVGSGVGSSAGIGIHANSGRELSVLDCYISFENDEQDGYSRLYGVHLVKADWSIVRGLRSYGGAFTMGQVHEVRATGNWVSIIGCQFNADVQSADPNRQAVVLDTESKYCLVDGNTFRGRGYTDYGYANKITVSNL